jgi:hypothetical protein
MIITALVGTPKNRLQPVRVIPGKAKGSEYSFMYITHLIQEQTHIDHVGKVGSIDTSNAAIPSLYHTQRA